MRTYLALALLAFAACDKKSESTKPAPTPIAKTDTPTTPDKPTTPPADVKDGQTVLLAAGAPGGAVLRYAAPQGTETVMSLRMTMAMEPSPFQLPPIVVSTSAKVISVSADGVMKVETSVTNFGVDGGDPQIAQAMAAMADKMKSFKFTADMSPQGTTTNVQVEGATDPEIAMMAAQIKDTMEQSAMPLPLEPVGKGATWRHRKKVSTSGMTATNDMTFELVEVVGSKATLKIVGTITGEPGMIDQGGQQIELKSLKGDITGQVVIDLAKNAVDGNLDTKMDMSMAAGGQQQSMKQSIAIGLSSK